jgi:tRNA pseudouridine-54 N-methylase
MSSLLFRAWNRAGEFRRVGLSVSQGQFADLTEGMEKGFSLVQLEAAGGKTEHRDRTGGDVTDLSAARTRKYA